MPSTEHVLTVQRVEGAIRFGGLLVRALVYAGIYAIADRYDCGRAILTGVLAGDFGSRLLSIAWEWRDNLLQFAAELALLLLVFLFVRSQMDWPEDLALRAIVGLAAFGVFSLQIGGTVFTRLGHDDSGFAYRPSRTVDPSSRHVDDREAANQLVPDTLEHLDHTCSTPVDIETARR